MRRFARHRLDGTRVGWMQAQSSGHIPGHVRSRYPPENDKTPAFAGLLEADDGVRTRDLRLGKPTLYQLSYVRARAKA
jgi:hypothetical protein